MRLFYKEKLDDKRIIHICGFRFEYRIVPIINKTGIESAPPPILIISLTSFPARISTLHITISSLLCQTKKPNMIILQLSEDEFPNKENDLPENLLKLKEFGLTINWNKGNIIK